MKKFRVWYRSKPGFYAQYNGYIDVFANDEDEAIDLGFRRMKQTFPERGRAMWTVEKVERVWS